MSIGSCSAGMRLRVLDVPAPADEQHAGVEEQQHEDRDDPQPVEEFVAGRARGMCHVFMAHRSFQVREELGRRGARLPQDCGEVGVGWGERDRIR